MRRSTISYREAAIVSAICFGLFCFWSIEAVFAGFPDARVSDAAFGWMIGLEITLAAVALIYLYTRGFDISSLYPAPSLKGSLIGLGLFAAVWLVGVVATSPLYDPSSPQMIEFLRGRLSLSALVPFAMVNGAFEEIFLLGVLVRGLRGYGLAVAIGFPLLVRVLYHLYQGPLGAAWVLVFGLTFSLAYIRGLQLWPPVLAHILWDIVPFAGSAA